MCVCYHDKSKFACIDFHQTGSVSEDSDHLQLIKFWPSCAPAKGVCGGAKNVWLHVTTASARCLRLSERFLPAGCLGNLPVLNLLSASVAKNQHFRPCRKNCIGSKNDWHFLELSRRSLSACKVWESKNGSELTSLCAPKVTQEVNFPKLLWDYYAPV